MRLKQHYPKIFTISCFVLALFKLWLVNTEEIIAFTAPHDDLWHIKTAAAGFWFLGKYTHMTLIQLPVYAMWIELVHFTGIPLRIASEIVYILSAFYFAVVLTRITIPRPICFLSFAAMILHPLTYHFFNRSLAESLYISVLLLALSGLIMLWLKRGQQQVYRFALLSGIYLGVLWNTRKESMLIILMLLIHFFLLMMILRIEKRDRSYIFKTLKVQLLIPIALIACFTFSIDFTNYLRYGLFVSTEMGSSGFLAANKALLRITPPESKRFIPVTKETRKLAYQVSPAFKGLEPSLEGADHLFVGLTRRYLGIENEIGAGWFYWALRDAASYAGHHVSAPEADSYYQRIADEINTAIDIGRLPGRFVFSSFLDPNISNYLPHLHHSFLSICRLFTSTVNPKIEKDDPNTPIEISNKFNVVANRRAALTEGARTFISGWIFHRSERISEITLVGEQGNILYTFSNFTARPDVASRLQEMAPAKIPIATGFSLGIPQIPLLENTMFVVVTQEGTRISLPYGDFVSRKPVNDLIWLIDSMIQPAYDHGNGEVQEFIGYWYPQIITIMSLLCVLAIAMITLYKFFSLNDNLYLIVLLSSVISARVALFTLLDASSWQVEPRYLVPVIPLYSCLLLLILYQSYRAVIWRRRSRITPGFEKSPADE